MIDASLNFEDVTVELAPMNSLVYFVSDATPGIFPLCINRDEFIRSIELQAGVSIIFAKEEGGTWAFHCTEADLGVLDGVQLEVDDLSFSASRVSNVKVILVSFKATALTKNGAKLTPAEFRSVTSETFKWKLSDRNVVEAPEGVDGAIWEFEVCDIETADKINKKNNKFLVGGIMFERLDFVNCRPKFAVASAGIPASSFSKKLRNSSLYFH